MPSHFDWSDFIKFKIHCLALCNQFWFYNIQFSHANNTTRQWQRNGGIMSYRIQFNANIHNSIRSHFDIFHYFVIIFFCFLRFRFFFSTFYFLPFENIFLFLFISILFILVFNLVRQLLVSGVSVIWSRNIYLSTFLLILQTNACVKYI